MGGAQDGDGDEEEHVKNLKEMVMIIFNQIGGDGTRVGKRRWIKPRYEADKEIKKKHSKLNLLDIWAVLAKATSVNQRFVLISL